MFASFLQFTSEKLHGFFGYQTPLFGEHTVLRYRDVSRTGSPTYWKSSKLQPGKKLNQPGPLFKKLEER